MDIQIMDRRTGLMSVQIIGDQAHSDEYLNKVMEEWGKKIGADAKASDHPGTGYIRILKVTRLGATPRQLLEEVMGIN